MLNRNTQLIHSQCRSFLVNLGVFLPNTVHIIDHRPYSLHQWRHRYHLAQELDDCGNTSTHRSHKNSFVGHTMSITIPCNLRISPTKSVLKQASFQDRCLCWEHESNWHAWEIYSPWLLLALRQHIDIKWKPTRYGRSLKSSIKYTRQHANAKS